MTQHERLLKYCSVPEAVAEGVVSEAVPEAVPEAVAPKAAAEAAAEAVAEAVAEAIATAGFVAMTETIATAETAIADIIAAAVSRRRRRVPNAARFRHDDRRVSPASIRCTHPLLPRASGPM